MSIPQQIIEKSSTSQALVTLYGDIAGALDQSVVDATGWIEDYRDACLADHRMIAVSGQWSTPRPYGEVLNVLRQAQALAKAAGWSIASAVPDILTTGTNIDDLRVVDEFPNEPAAHGYNAACAFVFEAEQPGTAANFDGGDVESLTSLAQRVLDLLK